MWFPSLTVQWNAALDYTEGWFICPDPSLCWVYVKGLDTRLHTHVHAHVATHSWLYILHSFRHSCTIYVFEVLVSHKSRMYNLSQCLMITHIKPENLNSHDSIPDHTPTQVGLLFTCTLEGLAIYQSEHTVLLGQQNNKWCTICTIKDNSVEDLVFCDTSHFWLLCTLLYSTVAPVIQIMSIVRV